uniref:(northern house mosquito) hypothetical protein n=1 Tax=Culex pipiens TaxID=7175 RepID=A0A8D8BNK3_CULPI
MKKDCFHNIIIKIIDVFELIPLFQVKCSAHRSQLVCFLEQPQNEPWSWSSRNQLWCCEVNANHFRFAVCHEPREKKMHKYIPNQFEPVSPTGRSVQPTAVFGSGLRHGPVIVVGSNGGTDHLRNVANAGLDFMPSSSVRSPRRCGNLWNARFSFSSSASEE